MIARVLNKSGAEALHAFTWNLIESGGASAEKRT